MALVGGDICLAPLRGVTVRAFREAHARWFAAPDRAVAPFIPTVAGSRIKPALLREVDPELEQAVPLIPQVIGKSPEELGVMLRRFRELGYREADLNVGCPWPFVIKKGRGAGLMRDAVLLGEMLAVGCEEMPGGFSVKVRLGIENTELLGERVELLNSYPLREVTIHARTARQMYEGEVDLEGFEQVAGLVRHPVVYNGDIRCVADLEVLQGRFPGVERWMIGRGLAIDPFLVERIRGGCEAGERSVERLRGFLDEYLALSEGELYGPRAVLGRMKELWSYLRLLLCDGERIWSGVKICRSLDEYRRVVGDGFGSFRGFVSESELRGF